MFDLVKPRLTWDEKAEQCSLDISKLLIQYINNSDTSYLWYLNYTEEVETVNWDL